MAGAPSLLKKAMVPASGFSRPKRSRNSVVFPVPDGDDKSVREPAGKARERSFKTSSSPKDLKTCSRRISAGQEGPLRFFRFPIMFRHPLSGQKLHKKKKQDLKQRA